MARLWRSAPPANTHFLFCWSLLEDAPRELKQYPPTRKREQLHHFHSTSGLPFQRRYPFTHHVYKRSWSISRPRGSLLPRVGWVYCWGLGGHFPVVSAGHTQSSFRTRRFSHSERIISPVSIKTSSIYCCAWFAEGARFSS